jgi:hypothetical protein
MKSKSLFFLGVFFLCITVFFIVSRKEHRNADVSSPLRVNSPSLDMDGKIETKIDVVQPNSYPRQKIWTPPEATPLDDFSRILVSAPHTFKLTNEQKAVATEEYRKLRTKRRMYEASIAAVTITEQGETLLEIPEYKEASEKMLADFFSSMALRLGADVSRAVSNTYLQAIIIDNEPFGYSAQDILISKEAGDGDTYKFVHQYYTDEGKKSKTTTVSQFSKSSNIENRYSAFYKKIFP